MSVSKRYTCNVCGAERKETNHWFVIRFTISRALRVDRWEDTPLTSLHNASSIHICGRSCLLAAIEKWAGQ